MTEPELKKLYAENVDFEDRADATNDAARLAEYLATHVRCVHGHHRQKSDEDQPCPVCHSLIPYAVETYPV
jgi:hypothetical protein